MTEEYVICDIETATVEDKPNADKDLLRYVGFKDHNGKGAIYHYTEIDKIQNVINYFPSIIGHNFIEYDQVVLQRYGIRFDWNKIIIDTLKIAKNRYKQMLYLDLPEKGYSLRNLCNHFDLSHKKTEMDYSILQKDILKGEEYEILKEYLEADLNSTDDLYKFNYNLFYGLKQFMSERDQQKYKWLTCSSGSTAYKIICNMAGLPEEYNDVEGAQKDYTGGFVSEPYLDYSKGPIYCVDFNSLYPNMFMGGNLYTPSTNGNYWNGCGIYPSVYANEMDGIKGKYSTKMGKIEKVIYDLYQQRLVAKKNKDERLKLAIKIIINTMYGISGSPKFKSVYNLTTASDCTAMARRSIKHARTVLEEYGYECLYTDTDSVYVRDTHYDYDALKNVCDYITHEQTKSFNIKIDTHQLEIEAEIKRMYFFKNDKGDYIKKHYAYVTNDDKIKLKGIKIVKGDCSPITLKVYEDIIKPNIIADTFNFYTAQDLYDITKRIAKDNANLLTKRYRVKPKESYKIPEGKEEPTCIGYQISKRYGAGEHYMVINRRIGVGKGNRYAPMSEIQKRFGDNWIDQVKIEEYMNDLKCFILPEERNKINKLDRKRI